MNMQSNTYPAVKTLLGIWQFFNVMLWLVLLAYGYFIVQSIVGNGFSIEMLLALLPVLGVAFVLFLSYVGMELLKIYRDTAQNTKENVAQTERLFNHIASLNRLD